MRILSTNIGIARALITLEACGEVRRLSAILINPTRPEGERSAGVLNPPPVVQENWGSQSAERSIAQPPAQPDSGPEKSGCLL